MGGKYNQNAGAKMKEGNIIWSMSPADDLAIEAARAFIKEMNLTGDDVKIAKRENAVNIILKRDFNGES